MGTWSIGAFLDHCLCLYFRVVEMEIPDGKGQASRCKLKLVLNLIRFYIYFTFWHIKTPRRTPCRTLIFLCCLHYRENRSSAYEKSPNENGEVVRGGNETPQEDYESTYSLPGTLGRRGVSSVYILTFGFKMDVRTFFN